MSAPFPWLTEAWQRLLDAHAGGRLAHAYLITGAGGLGTLALARAFAERVLCEASLEGGTACGRCRGCLLTASGNHPDLRLLQPEEERKSIVVDQVRELGDYYTLKTHYGGLKVAVLHPADSLNHAAANALLKLLEEPPAEALMLLVAERPGLLPATVVSRCQRMSVALPGWAERRAWLTAELAAEPSAPSLDQVSLAGAPLDLLQTLTSGRARLLDELIAELEAGSRPPWDPLAAARRYADTDARQFVDALERCVGAAALTTVGVASRSLALAPDSAKRLQQLANTLDLPGFLRFLASIGEARGVMQRSSGVRGGEIIESLWLNWAVVAQSGGQRESAR